MASGYTHTLHTWCLLSVVSLMMRRILIYSSSGTPIYVTVLVVNEVCARLLLLTLPTRIVTLSRPTLSSHLPTASSALHLISSHLHLLSCSTWSRYLYTLSLTLDFPCLNLLQICTILALRTFSDLFPSWCQTAFTHWSYKVICQCSEGDDGVTHRSCD